MLFDEVETARKLTYLDDRMSADGGGEAAVTARTRYGKELDCKDSSQKKKMRVKKTWKKQVDEGSMKVCLRSKWLALI